MGETSVMQIVYQSRNTLIYMISLYLDHPAIYISNMYEGWLCIVQLGLLLKKSNLLHITY